MKTILKSLFALSIVYFVFSCDSLLEGERIGSENSSSEKPVSIKINFIGTEYINNFSQNMQSPKNKLGGGKSLITKELVHYTEISHGATEFIKVDKIPDNFENLSYLESISVAKEGDALQNGVGYVILAYKKTRDGFAFYKNWNLSVGETDSKIELDTGENYTIIVVSTGTRILPKIVDVEDFDNARFIPPLGTNFLYNKYENFVPEEGSDNILNVKLKRSVSIYIRIKVEGLIDEDSGDESGLVTVNSINNVRICYDKPESINIGDLSKSSVVGLLDWDWDDCHEIPYVKTYATAQYGYIEIKEIPIVTNNEFIYIYDISTSIGERTIFDYLYEVKPWHMYNVEIILREGMID